jgi:hypothetical protein
VAPKDAARFVSCADGAKNTENRRIRFAKRNERFRGWGRKCLKSFGCEIGDFAESFVSNGLFSILFRVLLAWLSLDYKRLGALRSSGFDGVPIIIARVSEIVKVF